MKNAFLAVWKLSAEFQSYFISKRLKLQIFAWSRFIEFFTLFKMLMDFKQKVLVVFNDLIKIERLIFYLAMVRAFSSFQFSLSSFVLRTETRDPLAMIHSVSHTTFQPTAFWNRSALFNRDTLIGKQRTI